MIYKIQEGNSEILECLKNYPLKENKKNKFFSYVIKAMFLKDIIYENTLTGEVVAQNGELSLKDIKYLKERWFLIPENEDSYDIFNYIQSKLNKSKKSKDNLLQNFETVVVLTTLNCNASCVYCYEKNFCFKKENFSIENADKLIDLIKNRNKNINKKIEFIWFGGEPLVNYSIIDYISSKMIENNIDYHSTMVSNGLLFNEELVKKAKDLWHLTSVQITIDGDEKYYEKIKNVPPGSFNLLLDNISKILEQNIYVNIRLNVGIDNTDTIISALYEIKNKIKLPNKYFSIYTGIIFDCFDKKGIYKNVKKIDNYISFLFEENRKRRMWTHFGCMADSGKHIVVLPNGNISICEHCIDKDFVSNLDNTFLNKDVLNKYSNIINYSYCKYCPLKPTCITITECTSNGDNNCNEDRVKYLLEKRKKSILQLAKKKRKRRKHLMITKNLYTNLDIYNKATAMIEAFNTKDGSELNYPVKVNFYLQKNMNAFLTLAREIEQKRIEIIQKYGNPSEENPDEYKIPDDKIEEASKEIQDFLELEQEVPVSMLKLDWFDNIDMNAAQVAAISFMIEEEE